MYSDEVSMYADVPIRKEIFAVPDVKKCHILVCTQYILGCKKKYVPSTYFLPQLCTRFYTFSLQYVPGTYLYIVQKKYVPGTYLGPKYVPSTYSDK